MSATFCCIKSSTSEGSIFFLFLVQRQTESLTASPPAVTFDAEGLVGVVSARAQTGQTSPWGPSWEMNERNANAAKYQICFYRSMYACVSVGV